MKFKDILTYNNCVFVHYQQHEKQPERLSKLFTTAPSQHCYSYNATGSSSRNNTITKPNTNSVT